ncbi:MAG: hypothetical protein JXM69_07510 [Anaerolineae bacterium]|nr:hypothetical protein [Anaerolineae bacterium]
MKETQDQPSSAQEQETARELAWLEENLTIFWPTAHFGYEQQGRGAVVIEAVSSPLGEDTPFHYAAQAVIEAAQDEASISLARLVSTYDPERQFVAAILRPQMHVSTYQVEVGPVLVEAVRAYRDADYRPKVEVTGDQAGAALKPPDLETLMEWEAEGGCEAACPHHCWVEPDGVCQHGQPSWLLKLGLI